MVLVQLNSIITLLIVANKEAHWWIIHFIRVHAYYSHYSGSLQEGAPATDVLAATKISLQK